MTQDEDGLTLESADAARAPAAIEARNLAAESIKIHGHLILDDRIEVLGEDGERVATLLFGDVVEIRHSREG